MGVEQQVRAGRIREMFNEIAAGYDAKNRLFSADRDQAWRRRAARLAALRPGNTAIDLCTGTGKLAQELLPYVRPGGRVIGVDFSPAMLAIARKRVSGVEFRLADVKPIGAPDQRADAVTIAFGLRNLVDRDGALAEMFRVLRPGGRLVILEFPAPPRGPLMAGFRLYLEHVMPAVAGLFKRTDRPAYRYLSDSVQAFPSPEVLADQLVRIGFTPVSVERMTFGIVALHVAVRPA